MVDLESKGNQALEISAMAIRSRSLNGLGWVHDYQRNCIVGRPVEDGLLCKSCCGYTTADQSDCNGKKNARKGDIPRRIIRDMELPCLVARHVEEGHTWN